MIASIQLYLAPADSLMYANVTAWNSNENSSSPQLYWATEGGIYTYTYTEQSICI
jgi:hypothetical protein